MRRILQFAKPLGLLQFFILLAVTGCGNEKPAGQPKAVFARIRASVPPVSSASQGGSKRLQPPPAELQASSVSSETSSNPQNRSLQTSSFASVPLGGSSTGSGGEDSSFNGSSKLSSVPPPTFFQDSANEALPPSEPNSVPVMGGAPLPVFAANLPHAPNANNTNPAPQNTSGENLAANNAPAGGTNLPSGGVVLRGTPNLSSASTTAAVPPLSGSDSSGASSNTAARVNTFVATSSGGETGGTNPPPQGNSNTTVTPLIAPAQNTGDTGDSKIAAADGILSSNPDPVQAYEETIQMSLHVPGTPDFRRDVLITAPASPDQPFTGELELKAGYSSADDLFDCGEDCQGKTFVLRVMQCGVISEATLKEKLGDAASSNLSDNVSQFFYKMLRGEIAFETCPAPQYRDLKADANLKISFANFPLSVDGMYIAFLLPEDSAEREALGASALDNAVSLTGNKTLWDKNAQNWYHYIRIVSSPSLIPTP